MYFERQRYCAQLFLRIFFYCAIPFSRANRYRESSDSPILRSAPQMANVLWVDNIRPVTGSTSQKLIWILDLSLTPIKRLDAEHFRGTYKSTTRPSSFCIFFDVPTLLDNRNRTQKWDESPC